MVFGVWQAKRQYALNRELIAAIKKGDLKQATILVNEGADPTTRANPSPPPALPELIHQLLHPLPPAPNDSPTAFLMVCGARWERDEQHFPSIVSEDCPDAHSGFHDDGIDVRPQDSCRLIQTMLLHGAKVNTKDTEGYTALHHAVRSVGIEVLKILLTAGANPDMPVSDADHTTPITIANYHRPEIVPLLAQVQQTSLIHASPIHIATATLQQRITPMKQGNSTDNSPSRTRGRNSSTQAGGAGMEPKMGRRIVSKGAYVRLLWHEPEYCYLRRTAYDCQLVLLLY